MLGALGVVYGDIGTSPIYAFREALHAAVRLAKWPSREDMLGVLSLIVWALTIIVTIKYVAFVLRADNRGEGGTLSLMALARSSLPKRVAARSWSSASCGAALFYGDAVITPAISVLSAVEGMKVVTPGLRALCRAADACHPGHAVSPSSASARAASPPSSGRSRRSGSLRSASPGLSHIADDPDILLAVNPLYIVSFLHEFSRRSPSSPSARSSWP